MIEKILCLGLVSLVFVAAKPTRSGFMRTTADIENHRQFGRGDLINNNQRVIAYDETTEVVSQKEDFVEQNTEDCDPTLSDDKLSINDDPQAKFNNDLKFANYHNNQDDPNDCTETYNESGSTDESDKPNKQPSVDVNAPPSSQYKMGRDNDRGTFGFGMSAGFQLGAPDSAPASYYNKMGRENNWGPKPEYSPSDYIPSSDRQPGTNGFLNNFVHPNGIHNAVGKIVNDGNNRDKESWNKQVPNSIFNDFADNINEGSQVIGGYRDKVIYAVKKIPKTAIDTGLGLEDSAPASDQNEMGRDNDRGTSVSGMSAGFQLGAPDSAPASYYNKMGRENNWGPKPEYSPNPYIRSWDRQPGTNELLNSGVRHNDIPKVVENTVNGGIDSVKDSLDKQVPDSILDYFANKISEGKQVIGGYEDKVINAVDKIGKTAIDTGLGLEDSAPASDQNAMGRNNDRGTFGFGMSAGFQLGAPDSAPASYHNKMGWENNWGPKPEYSPNPYIRSWDRQPGTNKLLNSGVRHNDIPKVVENTVYGGIDSVKDSLDKQVPDRIFDDFADKISEGSQVIGGYGDKVINAVDKIGKTAINTGLGAVDLIRKTVPLPYNVFFAV